MPVKSPLLDTSSLVYLAFCMNQFSIRIEEMKESCVSRCSLGQVSPVLSSHQLPS